MTTVHKILIIGPAWVGDMVMAQTLFKLLREQYPNCELNVLAPAWSNALLARMPEVSASLNLAIGHGQLKLRERYRLAHQLRADGYDLAIILPNSFKSALIPFWAHIPLRRGWLGEWRLGLLTDHQRLNKKDYPLMVQRFAALAYPVGADLPEKLPWPKLATTQRSVDHALADFILPRPERPILALCPGAEFGPAKRWPAEYYAELAQAKLAEGWQVWIFGSAKDQKDSQVIQKLTDNRCLDFAGKTTLAQAIDLLSLATVVVSNDSGLMHIAAALERPLVVIYGSTDPRFTPPLSDKVQILSLNLPCSPCFKRECPLRHLDCLNKLGSDQVLAAIKLLSSPSRGMAESRVIFDSHENINS